MNFPDDLMQSLDALARAVAITTADGVIEAAIPDASQPDGVRFHEIPPEHLDELVERGWIELTDNNRVRSLDTGVYWLRRWRTEQARKARRSA